LQPVLHANALYIGILKQYALSGSYDWDVSLASIF
jgi:hypothetical protein